MEMKLLLMVAISANTHAQCTAKSVSKGYACFAYQVT